MKERLRWRAALLEGFAVLDSLRTWVAESEHYLKHVAGPDATPTYDEVREMVWRTGPARTTPLPRAAVDDLVSSGGFQLIRSAEVRRALAAYARSLDRDDEEQSDVREFFNTMVYPYHVHEGSFSEFPWEDYVELPESPVSFPLDVDRFARNRTYANLLISRMLEYSNLRDAHRDVIRRIDEALEALEGAF